MENYVEGEVTLLKEVISECVKQGVAIDYVPVIYEQVSKDRRQAEISNGKKNDNWKQEKATEKQLTLIKKYKLTKRQIIIFKMYLDGFNSKDMGKVTGYSGEMCRLNLKEILEAMREENYEQTRSDSNGAGYFAIR